MENTRKQNSGGGATPPGSQRAAESDQQVIKRFDTTPETNYNSNMMNYNSENKTMSVAQCKHKSHNTRATHVKKVAFTLAEVLITLGIIGIVAAMTIPTLVSNYQSKSWQTSANVFERKLEEALKTMNTQQVLSGYANTTDFVSELSKHLKITKVCQSDDILSCFEDKIYWGKNELEISVENVKTAAGLGHDDWKTDTLGVQFANGVTGIIAYNTKCKENPFTNQFSGTSCLALLYDINGFKTPNSDGKDLNYINVPKLDGHMPCYFQLTDGSCFAKPFYPEPLSKQECEELADNGFGNNKNWCGFNSNTDYWAGAVKTCGGVDKMANQAQLAAIATDIYGTEVSPSGNTYAQFNKEIAAEMGFVINPDWFYVWSGDEYSYSGGGHVRQFGPTRTGWVEYGYVNRISSNVQAVCVTD